MLKFNMSNCEHHRHVLVAVSKGMRAVKLLQQNPPVRNLGCCLMQVVVYNGRKTLVVVVTPSRVCAVAQYAVLEANGKVNGIGDISHPPLPNPWTNLDAASNISLRPPRESMCKI